MDDPLKGKVFQSPQEGVGSSDIFQPGGASQPAQTFPESLPPSESQALSQISTENPVPSEPEKPGKPITFTQTSGSQGQVPPESTPPSFEAPTQETQAPPKSPPRFSAANIIKLLIGFFSLSLIAFIIFGLILPSLNKKEEKVTLGLWDLGDSSISAVLPDFEKQNPNIKVDYVKQDIKDYKDRLAERIKNGTGPDIFRFHNTWVLQLSNNLLPIPSEIVTRDQFDKNYYPVAAHDLIKNGAIYGIPIELDTLSLFVNTALLKQSSVSIPTNWNDFISAARSLTLKDQSGKIKTAGAAMGAYDNITHAPDIISMLFAQDGVNMDDISQSKTRVSDALNFYTGFAQSDGSVWDSTLDPSILAFSKGNLALYFGYYKDQSVIKSSNPNLSFDIFNVPHLAGQDMSIASYFPLGISIKSKHQKEALALLKYLSQKEISQKLTSLPYARVDLPDRAKGAEKDVVSTLFSGETFDNGLNSQLNAHLGNVVNSITSGGTTDSAADSLILGFSQVLNQYLPKP